MVPRTSLPEARAVQVVTETWAVLQEAIRAQVVHRGTIGTQVVHPEETGTAEVHPGGTQGETGGHRPRDRLEVPATVHKIMMMNPMTMGLASGHTLTIVEWSRLLM